MKNSPGDLRVDESGLGGKGGGGMRASVYLSMYIYIMSEEGQGLLPIPNKPYGFCGR